MNKIATTLLAAVMIVGCGGGDGGADAGDIDAPVTRGTIAFAWAIQDTNGDPLACDDIGAGSVSITATPAAGGFGQVDPFSCAAGSGVSQPLEPTTYNVQFRLSGTAGTMDEPAAMTGVEVVANQQVDLGSITFAVDPVGNITFQVDTGASAGNCDPEGSGGGDLSSLIIELRDDEDICIPTTFAVDDPNDANAPDYVSDCSGSATAGCLENDVTLTVADADSGPHSLVIRGFKAGTECYSRTSQFTIPGADLTLDLPTQSLMLMPTLECDPNAADAGPADATPADAP
jgi:hypothetical protein